MVPAGKRSAGIAALVLVLVALVAVPAWADKDDLVLASRQSASDGALGGNKDSYVPSLSADGGLVAFSSSASNFAAGDSNTVLDVFVRNPQTNVTTLVSRQSAAAGGAIASGGSDYPAISADGRFVTYESSANNLSTEDDNNYKNIFVRDLQNSTTSLVSRGNVGDAAPNGDSYQPAISADGRFIAFHSNADPLPAPNAPDTYDIFVRDTQAGTTTAVSQTGGTPGDNDSEGASISADGRFVAYYSYANNLSNQDTDGDQADVFVRDLQNNTTTLVSRASGAAGTGGNGGSYSPAISADGRFVAFYSYASNLATEDNDTDADVFVRDLQTNTTTLVSRQSAADGGAAGDAASDDRPALSANGRYIAFHSDADNLSAADNNAVTNVFVRDTQAATTTLVSRQSAADGGLGADGSAHYYPSISADGRYVGIDDDANNLSAIDLDGTEDVFLRDVLGPPDPGSPPPDLPTTADRTPPSVDINANKRQRLGRGVKVVCVSNEATDIAAAATATAKGHAKRGKTFTLKPVSDFVDPGQETTLTLRPSKRAKRKLEAAAKGTARIALTSTDIAGNVAHQKVKIKLR